MSTAEGSDDVKHVRDLGNEVLIRKQLCERFGEMAFGLVSEDPEADKGPAGFI